MTVAKFCRQWQFQLGAAITQHRSSLPVGKKPNNVCLHLFFTSGRLEVESTFFMCKMSGIQRITHAQKNK